MQEKNFQIKPNKNSLKYLKNSNFIVTYGDGIANINFRITLICLKNIIKQSLHAKMSNLSMDILILKEKNIIFCRETSS